jgi:hypothetical protein
LLVTLVGQAAGNAVLVLVQVLLSVLLVVLFGKLELDGTAHGASPDSNAAYLKQGDVGVRSCEREKNVRLRR